MASEGAENENPIGGLEGADWGRSADPSVTASSPVDAYGWKNMSAAEGNENENPKGGLAESDWGVWGIW
jgi:hypothetical protein